MLSINKISRFVLKAYIIVFIVSTNVFVNRVGLCVVIAVCGFNWISNRRINKSIQLTSMFLYGLLLSLSMLYTICPLSKASTVLTSYWITFVIIFFINDNIDSPEEAVDFLKIFIVAAVVQLFYMLSVYGLNIFRVIQESEKVIRIGDQTSNSNSVGMSFAYGSVISFFVFQNQQTEHKKYNAKRVLCLIISVMTAAFALLSGSKKAVLILFLGIGVTVFSSSNVKKNVMKKIGKVLIAIIAMYLLYYVITTLPVFDLIEKRLTLLFNGLFGNENLSHTDQVRFDIARLGWEAFLDSPIIGHGIYSSYTYFGFYSHNNFIEILMNTGVVGFVIFYFPYLINLKRLLHIRNKSADYYIIAFFFCWMIFGGVGFVTYYTKSSMSYVMITSCWIERTLQREKWGIENEL